MQKLRCAILDDYQDAALSRGDWGSLSERVDVRRIGTHLASDDEVERAIGDCEIVVLMRERTPFGAALLERLPRLKLLITSGMRNASIDVAAANARGIVVSGTASASTPPVELTWALILALARHLVIENAALRSDGPWQSTVGADLHGKRLGLLGLGKIGSKVATVGAAFGMEVIAWSQNLTPERAAAAGAKLASSKEELLRTSDFVSIHLVLSDRTRGLVDRTALALMRPDARLINTSRSAIVDAAALVEALESGRLAGAALDVFDVEPLPVGDPLRTCPRLLATPHLGYVTEANYRTYFREAVENIEQFLAGTAIRELT